MIAGVLPRGAMPWVLTALAGLGCGHSRRAPTRADVADAPRAPARATRFVEHRERCRPSGCCGGPSVCGLVPLECSALFTVLAATGPLGPSAREDSTGTQAALRPDGSLVMVLRTGGGLSTPEPVRLTPGVRAVEALARDGDEYVVLGAPTIGRSTLDAWWLRCEAADCAQTRHRALRVPLDQTLPPSVASAASALLATRARIEREAYCQRSSAGCLGARPTEPTSPPPRSQASPSWRVVTRGVRIGIVPVGAPEEAATWIHEERAGTVPLPRYRVEGSASRRDGGLVVISVEGGMSHRVVLVRLDDAQHPVGRPVLVGIDSSDVEALDCGAEGPCVLTLRGERGGGTAQYELSLPPLNPWPERDPPAPWDGRCRIDP